MKLIKLSDIHYIIVDDTEPNVDLFKEGYRNITHSTQPLEKRKGHPTKGGGLLTYDKIHILSLSEVEEAINGYSVEELAEKKFPWMEYGNYQDHYIEGYQEGFKSHQELVKDKLFTVEDMNRAIDMSRMSINGYVVYENYDIVESLLPNNTEWSVTFDEYDKLKLI